jgi:hypothetical protein
LQAIIVAGSASQAAGCVIDVKALYQARVVKFAEI